ncbi:alpha-(1,3)-fucosyltransferase C-like [Patella vulgata]|uniref:alpha-(1,3)-fucosyltransferase C-like n=1 Tax=Patella vulgata TaxID=6465 RepID=UPI0024A9D218|nr:alpha-(1,3)-fucosyltransferase C-like [Patella vulgata]
MLIHMQIVGKVVWIQIHNNGHDTAEHDYLVSSQSDTDIWLANLQNRPETETKARGAVPKDKKIPVRLETQTRNDWLQKFRLDTPSLPITNKVGPSNDQGDNISDLSQNRFPNLSNDIKEHKGSISKKPLSNTKVIKHKYKTIVVLNRHMWFLRGANPGHGYFSRCEYKMCELSFDEKEIKSSAAIMFYGVSYPPKPPPARNNPDQVWILAAWESPIYMYGASWENEVWTNKINWTMTYRIDSDIPTPGGEVVEDKRKIRNYDVIMKKKTKLIAWVVSHCRTQSKREAYVKHLEKVVPVDIFGRCGTSKPTDVFGLLNTTYKFYLSFENSLCKDYITEKLFDRQNLDIVPIVRGIGNYTQFYPKASYIDTRDFKSVEELGKYLQYLDRNNTAYVQYLKAKEHLYTRSMYSVRQKGYCTMCKKLHNLDQNRHSYPDINQWLLKDKCVKPTDI